MEVYKHAEKNAGGIARPDVGGSKMVLVDNRENTAAQAKLIRGIRTASPAIQRSGDFSASVALRTVGTEDGVPAENVFIDTVKLTGRTNTGLTKVNTKTQKHEPTQGDHIIADTFMKTYQKVMLRDHNILGAIEFYENNFQTIFDAEADLDAVGKILTGESEQGQRHRVVEKEVAEGRANIEMLKKGPRSILLWRKGLVQVINNYNEAYSHSKAATVYNSSRPTGKGEAALKKSLKVLFTRVPPGSLPENIPLLIDMAAIQRTGYPLKKFIRFYRDMVNRMHPQYLSHKAWSDPMKDSAAKSMFMPKPDIPEPPEMKEVRRTQDLVSSIGGKVASYARLMALAGCMGIDDETIGLFERNLGWRYNDPSSIAPLVSHKKDLEETPEEGGPFDILKAIKAIQLEGVNWMIELNTLNLVDGNDDLKNFVNLALEFLLIPISGRDVATEVMSGYEQINAMKETLLQQLALLEQQLLGPSDASMPAQGAP